MVEARQLTLQPIVEGEYELPGLLTPGQIIFGTSGSERDQISMYRLTKVLFDEETSYYETVLGIRSEQAAESERLRKVEEEAREKYFKVFKCRLATVG